MGRSYLEFATATLNEIEAHTAEIIDSADAVPLRISSPRLFATGWLIPRLKHYQNRYPSQSVMLNFAKSSETPDHETDVAFRKGSGNWPGMSSILLMKIVMVPVCSPAYLAAHGPIASIDDLKSQVLLDAPNHSENWASWLARNGRLLDGPRQIKFQETGLAYQAALEGMGLALGRIGLIDADLTAGRLVVPLDLPVESPDAIFLTHRHLGRVPSRIANFNKWIMQELRVPLRPKAHLALPTAKSTAR